MTSFAVKLIALAAMLIDHCTLVLTPPHYYLLRGVGRIAFPLFCFMIADGFTHTRSPRRYLGRLLLFAAVSQVPFALVVSSPGESGWLFSELNVFFTLAAGLALIMLADGAKERGRDWYILLAVTAVLLLCLTRSDYGFGGAALILALYLCRSRRIYQVGALAAWAFFQYALSFGVLGRTQFYFAMLAALPMLLYNGRRGPGLKWLFYAFYPAHLLILGIVKVYIC